MRFSRETFWGLFHLINNQMVAAVRGEGPVSLPSETVPTPLLFLSFSFILLSVNVYNSGACRTDSVPCKKPEWMTTRDCAGLVFLLSCSIVVLFQTHHDSDEKVKKKEKEKKIRRRCCCSARDVCRVERRFCQHVVRHQKSRMWGVKNQPDQEGSNNNNIKIKTPKNGQRDNLT